MKTEIKAPEFERGIANILAEVRNRVYIDKIDIEVLEEILKGELKEYYDALNEYYEEEYYNAIASARNKSYDDGYDDGYDVGFDNGYADCHANNKF